MPAKKTSVVVAALIAGAAFLGAASLPAKEGAGDPQLLFRQGNEAYRSAQYPEAVRHYEAALASGWENGELYYNLGNAYFKSSQKGLALWAYVQATRLMPRDADLQSNLRYLREQLSASSERGEAFLPAGLLSFREWAWFTAALVWLAALAWSALAWLPHRQKAARAAALGSTASAAIVFAWLAFMTYHWDLHPKAVVVQREAQARFAPQPSATPHFALPEGEAVRVLGKTAGWLQVRRRDGLTGWLPADAARPLR